MPDRDSYVFARWLTPARDAVEFEEVVKSDDFEVSREGEDVFVVYSVSYGRGRISANPEHDSLPDAEHVKKARMLFERFSRILGS